MVHKCGMAISRVSSRFWVSIGLIIAALFAHLAIMNVVVQASALYHYSTTTTSTTPPTPIFYPPPYPTSTAQSPIIQSPVIPQPPNQIRESVVISTADDAEKEAQDLYDKALKQFGSYGASARNICATWELRGCQCTGSVEDLTLSCRDVGLVEVPDELPVEIVKL